MNKLIVLLFILTFYNVLGQKAIVSYYVGSGFKGFKNGIGKDALLNQPNGLAVDKQGNLYIADQGNNCIRKVTPDGVVTVYAGSRTAGFKDGPANEARFNGPCGMTVDEKGNLFVCDYYNHCIRKIDPNGIVSTYAGIGLEGYKDGKADQAMFHSPLAVVADKQGNLYVGDFENHAIRKISTDRTVSTFVGGKMGNKDGTGEYAQIAGPASLSMDKQGNIFLVDVYNSSIRKITPSGYTTTVLSKDLKGFVDSTIVIGKINFQSSGLGSGNGGGIMVDDDGDLYIADGPGNVVLFVNMSSKVVKFLAGNGTPGLVDGEGLRARFNNPIELARDPRGYIYVADFNNHAVRKIEIIKEKPKEKQYFLAGMITDISNNKGIDAELEIKDLTTQKTVKWNTNSEGRYKNSIQPGIYKIYVYKEGYLPFEKEIKIEKDGEEVVIFNAELTKITVGAKAVLGNINFKPSSAEFDESAKTLLDKVADFLIKHPKIKVQVNGHTDIGKDQDYNIRLSTQRALAIVNYLKAKGVNPAQLSYKGYGNAKPIADNNTVEGRALNRRIEFEILGQ
jgi:outer membrane protein OmpA-like peptidoglycan-associated protein/sugar lactone lactonase YvrE